MTEAGTELRDDRGAAIRLVGRPPLRGGEASVYEAVDATGRPVAVKVAHVPDACWLAEERARLTALGEAPETRGLVAHVRGGGDWGGRPFFVLDWYPSSLVRWLEAGPLPARRRAMAARLAEVVATLHEARPDLVHRDLKPSNVLLDAEERLYLADFGGSRVTPLGQTMTLRAVHTPGYGPPEHALPGPQRPCQADDVYALAATIFHVLVGRPASAPRRNAQRLTPDGERLVLGLSTREDADTERWLDYGGMTALDPRDRRDLAAAIGQGHAWNTMLAALEPRPSRRRTRAADLAASLADDRAIDHARARARRVRGIRLAAVIGGAVAVAVVTTAFARAVTAPAPIAYPTIPFPPGAYTDPVSGAEVRVDAPFELGVHEVTQAQWRLVTGQDPSTFRENVGARAAYYCRADHRGESLVGEDLPAVCVTWYDAVRFANQLSAREGLSQAYRITLPVGTHAPTVEVLDGADGYRLPTVAEWTYAAVHGSAAPPVHTEPCRVGNGADARSSAVEREACDDGFSLLAPVGSFPASPAGIHDLVGNVSEWAWDAAPDDARWHAGTNFGSLMREPTQYAYRGPSAASMRSVGLGVRLARAAR